MTVAPLLVHIVYRFAVGGLENGLVNLVNRLPRGAWRHTIVSLTDIDHAFARRIDAEGVELIALGKSAGHALDLYPRLWTLLRRWQPALVHTRNLAALDFAPVAWAARVPVRVHGEHGRDAADPGGRNRRRQQIRKLYRPFVTRYVAVSPDLASYLRESIGVPAARVEQIFNGVDIERFSPSSERMAIAGCPFDRSHFIVGSVGRLDAVKDHANLAHAFVRLLAREPALRDSLRLVIVGEGAERQRVESILADNGAREFAWLPGERHDIADILRGLDVFVLPSLGEGVSNTVLEAMASGLPIVATSVGANADLVGDGVCARIVPPANADALGAAIAAYARETDLAKAHGAAARARVEQRFSLERMVDRYHALYLSLIGRGSESAIEGATRPRASH